MKKLNQKVLRDSLIILFLIGLLNFSSVYGLASEVTMDSSYGSYHQSTYIQSNHFYEIDGEQWFFGQSSETLIPFTWDSNSSWTRETQHTLTADLFHDFTTYYDGTYVYMATTGTQATFRRGIFENDTTVTWSGAKQNIFTDYCYDGSLYVDSNGYAYYLAIQRLVSDAVHLWKNGNNDGTWATASGYPKHIDSGINMAGQGNYQYLGTKIFGDDDDNLYMFYGSHNVLANTLRFNTYINDVVGTAQTVSDSVQVGSNSMLWNVVQDYYNSEILYIAYVKESTYNIMFLTYNMTSGQFSEAIQLDETTQSNSGIFLTYDVLSKSVFISWCESAIHVLSYDTVLDEFGTEETLTNSLTSLDANDLIFCADLVLELDYIVYNYVKYSTNDLFSVSVGLDVNRTASQPPPEADIIEYESLFFYAGIVSIIVILMGIAISKKRIGV